MQITYPTWKWLAIGIGLVLLLMMLFYPFGYDQMAFMIGGEMTVKHGAIPYRDFLDTKPPVIFFIYGISSFIFGHHEWSIRLFDILFQIGSLLYFFRILKRITGEEKLPLLIIFLYILFYVTSGYWMTAQAETFALLPALIAFDMTEKVRSPKSEVRSREFVRGIFSGIACAILFLLKFTLLTIPVGIFLYLLLDARPFPKKYFAGLLASFIALSGLYALYLQLTGTMPRFLESLVWVSQYGGMYPLLSSYTIGERFYKVFPIGLLVAFSLTGLLIATIGMFRYFKNQLSERPSTTDNRPSTSPAFTHFFIQFLLGLAAVLYERKFFPYQFSRMYWAFVPFVALGIIQLANLWKKYMNSWQLLQKRDQMIRYFYAVIIFGVLLFFSAAMRLISQPLHWTYMTITGGDIPQNVQDEMPQYYYKEQIQLADHLRPLVKTEDNIFIWGNNVGVYYFLRKYPTTICLTNTPLVTSWTPQSWKTKLLEQLTGNPPRFFISEFGDQRTYITGEEEDSWHHLEEWKELRDFVADHYEMKEELGHFKIFERKSGYPGISANKYELTPTI